MKVVYLSRQEAFLLPIRLLKHSRPDNDELFSLLSGILLHV